MIEDALLIVSMAFIAYGLWDRTKIILIFGGVLCFFIILMGDDNDNNKTENTP